MLLAAKTKVKRCKSVVNCCFHLVLVFNFAYQAKQPTLICTKIHRKQQKNVGKREQMMKGAKGPTEWRRYE